MAANDNSKCRNASIVLSLIHDDDGGEGHIPPIRVRHIWSIHKLTAMQPSKSNRKSRQTIVTHVRLLFSPFLRVVLHMQIPFVFVSFIYISIVLSSRWQQQPKKNCAVWVLHYENEMQINDERREEVKLNLSHRSPTYTCRFIRPKKICKKKRDLLNDLPNGEEKWILYTRSGPACSVVHSRCQKKIGTASLELQ